MSKIEPEFTFDQLIQTLQKLQSEYGAAEQEIKGYCRQIVESSADEAAHLIGWMEMEVMRRNDIHKEMRKIGHAVNVLNRAVYRWVSNS